MDIKEYVDDLEQAKSSLRTVISFLVENEQYGDNWNVEIKDLESLLAFLSE